MFQPLTGLYEPSSIQQLADGRFLVVEDEKSHPFSLVTISTAGDVSSTPLLPPAGDDAGWKLDDLEALALDRAGYVYALTSHSRDTEGDEKKSRDKLVRFRVEGGRMVEPMLVRGLKPALVRTHPVLAAAADIADVKSSGGFNIEAMEISADGQQLLVGFRSPLLEQRAIIACVENPAAIFERCEPPRVLRTLITLDLGGDGIRGLAYLPTLDGYLVISGPVASQQVHFQLWFWSGLPDAPARRVSVAGLPGFEHAEGVSPAVIDDRQRIIIVSDDGSRKDGRDAHFVLLDAGQLLIAP
ncbi:MAG: hypothetical protein A2580_12875 [Hydrogenophilales bacterium RIFOXYD1_FULL_62_11]|nr:MAG: hypothetical protein A2580_12875 [Hydrogenophilales bacterium RIFOXYD1_FULL_62_11]